MREPADFLVEIGTEELPPKALKNLMERFAEGIGAGLDKARLTHEEISAYASPRRLAVIVSALESSQADRNVGHKGPPVAVAFDEKGEPTKAALAFAGKCGVPIGALERQKTDAGEWLTHQALEKGRPSARLIPGIVQSALDALPIPRRMRWGAHDQEFVRPVHWLVMLHVGAVVPGSVLGIEAGRNTCGHRFMCSGEIPLNSPDDYASTLLEKGYVVADFAARRARIVAAVTRAAEGAGGIAAGNDALYDEVTALTEWPVPLTGAFDKDFLALPKEAIIATLTSHQRYFPITDAKGALLPSFVAITNLESSQPERIRDGNERVIRARLADAKFFYDTDRQVALGARVESLQQVVYQKGLGTLHDRSMRVAALASLIAAQLGANQEIVTRAAVLAKCDLLTGMVGEFPELQGTMGAYYAAESNEPQAVSQAIGEQYLPGFAGDQLPASAAGQILAVAEKLDTLAGVFVAGRKPSGNRDPFGLRRVALGVVRILLEKELDLDLCELTRAAVVQQPASGEDHGAVSAAVYDFIIDRLRAYVVHSGQGISSEMFDAVRARRPASLVDFRQRLAAVAGFMQLEPAVSLAAANKRTANILRQAGYTDGAELDASLLTDDAERVLYHALQAAESDLTPLIDKRDYSESLKRLAELRAPIDSFFDDVMVMSEDPVLRNNRLALLASLRALFLDIADISRLTPPPD